MLGGQGMNVDQDTALFSGDLPGDLCDFVYDFGLDIMAGDVFCMLLRKESGGQGTENNLSITVAVQERQQIFPEGSCIDLVFRLGIVTAHHKHHDVRIIGKTVLIMLQ